MQNVLFFLTGSELNGVARYAFSGKYKITGFSKSVTGVIVMGERKEEGMHQDRVEIDPRVCGGKPVIRGTRIPVAVIVAQLAEGQSWQDVMNGYPELSAEDIRAALQYASDSVENTEFAETVAG